MTATTLFQDAVQAHGEGRLDDAERGYRVVLTLAPEDSAVLAHIGVLMLERGRWEEGIGFVDRSLAFNPAQDAMLINRGNALIQLGRFDEALASYEAAIALQTPEGKPEAYNNLAVYLHTLGRFDDALAFYGKAIALKPDMPEAWGNRGSTLTEAGRLDEALEALDRAIALNPGYVDALTNRGVALYDSARLPEALAAYDRAIAVAPDYAEAHWNRAHALLLAGNYAEGWRAFEWRWRRAEAPPEPRFDGPLWLGQESLAGKTILLHAEQGLGDTLQMLRYAPLLAARGAKVVARVQAPLSALAARAPGIDQVIAPDASVALDFHCPMMSLPLALGARLDTIPADIPYLSAPPEKIAEWTARLGPKTRRRIGLAWSGNPDHKNDRNRSIPLEQLLPLLDADAEVFSLQKDYRDADYAVMRADGRIRDCSRDLGDFTDTAALTGLMDLVISVDTSVAHLAGALGKPLLLLLPRVPDYRWGLTGASTPWYPTARLLRQNRARDWSDVIAEAGQAIGQGGSEQPGDARALAQQGDRLYGEGRLAEAVEAFDRSLALNADAPQLWVNRAAALSMLGRLDEALDSFGRAIALKPDHLDALANRALALQFAGRFEEAVADADRAIAIDPQRASAHNIRALALVSLNRREEALAGFDRALALQPDFSEALNNRGLALHELDRHEEALAGFDRALGLQPQFAEAWNNRGMALAALSRFPEALAAYDRAIALNPGFAAPHFNKSTVLLLLEDYQAGWPLFEWRWKRAAAPPAPRFDRPLWLGGEPVAGKTILLQAEQGLGDTIQMLRYAPVLAKQGARVLLGVQAPLIGLASRVEGVHQVGDVKEPPGPFDLYCPMMSLPLALGTRVETIPADIPYVSATPEKLAEWRTRLGPRTRRRVGLAWSGNPQQPNDRNRSMALQKLLPLLEADADFFSLQKDYREADAAVLRADGRIRDFSGHLESFDDTAALTEQMDLAVSVCTSIAHLAGALGKPVFILLMQVPDYRWHLNSATSPWYPSARLIRQTRAGDWDGVVAEALAALRQVI